MQDTPLLTIAQAAERLNVPYTWLRDKVTARQVPHHRLGKHVRFTEDDLDQLLARSTQAPTPSRVPEKGRIRR